MTKSCTSICCAKNSRAKTCACIRSWNNKMNCCREESKCPSTRKSEFWLLNNTIQRKWYKNVLYEKALTPSAAWKTPKQIMKTVSWLETTTKDFIILLGLKVKRSIDTLEDSANTVITNLDEIGANIGKSIKETTGKSPVKTFVSEG